MNLRFPEVFGLLLFIALLCSFVLPRHFSGRIENAFNFAFAPIPWVVTGRAEQHPADVPIITTVTDEVARLRAEKLELTSYVETLRGQIETLANRQTEAERVGKNLRDLITPVKVVAADAAGRDVLRSAGTAAASFEAGQPVITNGNIVGRLQDVTVGNQASVRLVTDRGFKIIGEFGRYQHLSDDTIQLGTLPLEPFVLEGMSGGSLRIDSLKIDDVKRVGVQVGDLVFLSDRGTADWPIEVHGYRIGVVAKVGQKLETPGVAEIIVKPEVDLMKLKEVWVLGKK